MIVRTNDLERYQGEVSMVDGGFDPFHAGHVSYLRASASFGLPVLCNLAPDRWIAKKHPVLLPQADRALVLDAIRWVDYTHPSCIPTAEVLALLRPRRYVKGADWRDRLPAEELDVCTRLGIEIVFVDTVHDSSSRILDQYVERLERFRCREQAPETHA